MCVLTKDGTTEMVSRAVWGVMGIRAVWGGVCYGRDDLKAPQHGNAYQEDVWTNNIKTLLDRDYKLQKSGVIYKFKYPHINFPEEYIVESDRTFEDRLKNILGPHPHPPP